MSITLTTRKSGPSCSNSSALLHAGVDHKYHANRDIHVHHVTDIYHNETPPVRQPSTPAITTQPSNLDGSEASAQRVSKNRNSTSNKATPTGAEVGLAHMQPPADVAVVPSNESQVDRVRSLLHALGET